MSADPAVRPPVGTDRSAAETAAAAPTRRRGRIVATTLVVAAVVGAPTLVLAWRSERGGASFGDSEQVGRNRLAAATLDIEVGDRTTPLIGERVAPGDLLTAAIELVNAGTVPLRYALTVSARGEAALGPWLTWSFTPAVAGVCPSVAAWRSGGVPDATVVAGDRLLDVAVPVLGDPAPGADPGDRVLAIDAREQLCVAMEVDLSAPNSVQDATAELTVVANAEQLTSDESSSGAAPSTSDGIVP